MFQTLKAFRRFGTWHVIKT